MLSTCSPGCMPQQMGQSLLQIYGVIKHHVSQSVPSKNLLLSY